MSPLVVATPPRRSGPRRGTATLLVLVLLFATVPLALFLLRSAVVVEGPAAGSQVGLQQMSGLSFRIRAAGPVDRLRVSFDGQPLTLGGIGHVLEFTPMGLADGRHVLTVEAPGRLPFLPTRLTRWFVVDTSPPALSVKPAVGSSPRTPMTVTGTVAPDARLTADGRLVTSTDGRFRLDYRRPPTTVRLEATDPAGNVTAREVRISLRKLPMRAVHLTAVAWSLPALREPVLALIRAGRINAVELDVKDEGGTVGYTSGVPLAQESGAASGTYDPIAALEQLHAMGVRVIGRIVCFRDPVLAQWAWQQGRRSWVIQAPDGSPYKSRYGEFSFTNFASPEVRRYNIELASEAARLGFDDVLYDYVRRPDGALSSMRFPGSRGTPETQVAAFVRDSAAPVRAAGAYLGLSVFGIAATRPTEIAQDIPAMGRYADYVAPMVYPSHWSRGEYGVPDPNAAPYEIVRRSLADFQKDLAGSGTTVVPWLQDFSYGRRYGSAEVRAQIDGARSLGIDSFVLWNAGATYTAAALAPGLG